MKFGLLVVLAVAVLVPSLSEGRTVSKCELKEQLEQAITLPPQLQQFKEEYLAIVICEANSRSGLNTNLVKVFGKRTTTTQPISTDTTNSTLVINRRKRHVISEESDSADMDSNDVRSRKESTLTLGLYGIFKTFEETVGEESNKDEGRKSDKDEDNDEKDEDEDEDNDEKDEDEDEDNDEKDEDEDEDNDEKDEDEDEDNDEKDEDEDEDNDEKDEDEDEDNDEKDEDEDEDNDEKDEDEDKDNDEKDEDEDEDNDEKDEDEDEDSDEKDEDEDEDNDEKDEDEAEEGGKRKKRSTKGQSSEESDQSSLGLYGLFQLSDETFCNSGYRSSKNKCNTTCDAFTDDNIVDDIACFVNTDQWRLFLKSASHLCRIGTKNYFDECK